MEYDPPGDRPFSEAVVIVFVELLFVVVVVMVGFVGPYLRILMLVDFSPPATATDDDDVIDGRGRVDGMRPYCAHCSRSQAASTIGRNFLDPRLWRWLVPPNDADDDAG